LRALRQAQSVATDTVASAAQKAGARGPDIGRAVARARAQAVAALEAH
jgi:tRNA nucleotidyltransferase (CCA-adding enzyme)